MHGKMFTADGNGPFYKFGERLRAGSFGQVFCGEHLRTGRAVAIKIEPVDNTNNTFRTLKHECKILHYLRDRGCRNVPPIDWWSTVVLDDDVKYNMLVLPLLEMTLADVVQHRGTKPSAQAICEWVQEMIRIVRQVHEAGILHRDIKPQNFMLRNGVVYLIDFGLSSVYVDDVRGHFPSKPPSEHVLGTPKYVSLHVHDGHDASRRDDVISVGYVWLYLRLGGTLPWDDHAIADVVSPSLLPRQHILHPLNLERKRQKERLLDVLEMLEVSNSRGGMSNFFTCAYQLDFDETPEYATLLEYCV